MQNDIQIIIDEVTRYQQEGHKQIKLDKLLNYLNSVNRQTSSTSHQTSISEFAKLEYQGKLAAHKDSNLELFKAVITFANNSIRSLLMLNGGAAVAMLTFTGNMLGKTSNEQITDFANALGSFSIGALFSVFCSGMAYIGQCYFSEKPTSKYGYGCRIASIVLGFLSMFAFCCGIYFAYCAITTGCTLRN